MSATRPLIGVTGPDRGGALAWQFTRLAIWRAGGRALRIRPAAPADPHQLHGLVLGGGADVTVPSESTEVAVPQATPWWARALSYGLYTARRLFGDDAARLDLDRDRLEFALLQACERRGIPVLGICRGSQLMNVSRGGTLHRSLKTFYVDRPNPHTALPRKPVDVEENSRLRKVLERSTLRVNSLHAHAVATHGRDVTASAYDRNGVIQAVEDARRPFWVGVQWHPEYLPYRPAHQRLFRGVVAAAKQAMLDHSILASPIAAVTAA